MVYVGSLRENKAAAGSAAKSVKVMASPMTHLPIEGQRRSSSIRDKGGRALPTSPLAAGILRQQSVATPTGSFVQRTVIPHTVVSSSVGSDQVESGQSVDCHPLGAKCKPRLTRQIAFQEEGVCPAAHNKSVSFNTAASSVLLANKEEQRNYCPLHSPRLLQGVWESSIEEDFEEIDDPLASQQKATVLDKSQDKPSIASKEQKKKSYIGNEELLAAVASIYNNRDKNRLGLSGFIPRKLSTISSRSCSVNPDNETGATEEDDNDGHVLCHPEPLSPEPTTSQESGQITPAITNKDGGAERQLSKSDHDLYQREKQAKIGRKSIGSIVRLIVTPETTVAPSSPVCQQPCHLIQSPESRELEGSAVAVAGPTDQANQKQDP